MDSTSAEPRSPSPGELEVPSPVSGAGAWRPQVRSAPSAILHLPRMVKGVPRRPPNGVARRPSSSAAGTAVSDVASKATVDRGEEGDADRGDVGSRRRLATQAGEVAELALGDVSSH